MCSSPKRFKISVPEPTSLHKTPFTPVFSINSSINFCGNAFGYVVKAGCLI